MALPAAETARSAVPRTSMDESRFQAFYDQTARPLKAYLLRLTGSAALADDLLQEAYYRILRAELPEMDEAGRRNYLFRAATNLARDHFRRKKFEAAPLAGQEKAAESAPPWLGHDIRRALGDIEPRERELVLLAYVEGASHREIAAVTGLKEASVRPMLFRAKQRLADILKKRGFRPKGGA
jgi:RNA polymerase sigma-70 factor (ECF subfamily)